MSLKPLGRLFTLYTLLCEAIELLPQLALYQQCSMAKCDSFTSYLQLSISQTSPASALSFKLSGKGWTLRHDSPMLVCTLLSSAPVS